MNFIKFQEEFNFLYLKATRQNDSLFYPHRPGSASRTISKTFS